MDGVEFRKVMSRFAAGVTVVTALSSDDVPIGFTATAFCSVSLDPPLALVCVQKGRYAHDVLSTTRLFGVSVLAVDQQAIAVRFADPRIRDRFSAVDVRIDRSGVPLVDGAIAGLVCEHHSTLPAGDHTVYVGRALHCWRTDGSPLLHFGGAFNALAEPAPVPGSAEIQMSDWLVGAPW